MQITRVYAGGFQGGYVPARNTVGLKLDQYLALRNLRYGRGALYRRPGTAELGPSLGSYVIRVFGTSAGGTYYLLTCLADDVLRYVGDTNSWESIRGSETLTGTEDDVWSLTSWARRVYLSNGVDATWYWEGAGTTLQRLVDNGPSAISVPPARWLVGGFADRLWLAHTFEQGKWEPQRVRWTQRSTDDYWSGYGSGAADMVDDTYPITGMHVIAGRLVIFKGDSRGGSIVVGQQTGLAAAPVHFETLNPGSGIGCPAPRTIVPVGASMVAFLGHDGVYLFDGSSLRPVGGLVSKHIVESLEPRGLHRAFAWYDQVEKAYVLCVNESDSVNTATTMYTLNIETGTWTGPDDIRYTDVGTYVFQDVQSWETSTGAWEDHTETWQQASGSPSEPRWAVGTSSGQVYNLDSAADTDLGERITQLVRTADISFTGVQVYAQSRRLASQISTASHTLKLYDEKTLHTVTLTWRDRGSWTPTVRVIVDGGTAYTLADGTRSYGSGSERIMHTSWNAMLTGRTFRVEIEYTGNPELLDISYEVTYAGKRAYA